MPRRTKSMPSSSNVRVKNQPSMPPPPAFTPNGEESVVATALQIDEAGVRILINFFLQLRKWDTLQSTRTLVEEPDYCQDIAA